MSARRYTDVLAYLLGANDYPAGEEELPSDPLALHGAIARAVQLHGNRPIWQAMQRAAMRANVSWDSSAARYAALYRDLLAEAA